SKEGYSPTCFSLPRTTLHCFVYSTFRSTPTKYRECDLMPFRQKGEITGVPCTGTDESHR
ncbi:unnamed protein product, partial [Ascophyllum nodosum]